MTADVEVERWMIRLGHRFDKAMNREINRVLDEVERHGGAADVAAWELGKVLRDAARQLEAMYPKQ